MGNAPDKPHILVIKLSAFGDFIQALGPMAAIRRHHKDAHITLLTTKAFKDFGQQCGYFDDIWIDHRPSLINIGGWLSLRKSLIGKNFSRIYDLQNNDRTAFYFRLFPHKKRPEWVGAAKGASHSNQSPERTSGHAYEGHVQTLGLAGIKDIDVDDLRWIKSDLSGFNLHAPYVLLVPGSAPQHLQKRWASEHYAALGRRLLDDGFQPVLLGTQADRAVTQKIIASCPNALDLTGKTSLFQIAALAHDAQACVGNDTGPMHMIGPTGCPCLVLFSGHSNPKRHAPKGNHVVTLQKENLEELKVETVWRNLESCLAQAA
jgi:ADP-heptose:LPS heptosyltransferase